MPPHPIDSPTAHPLKPLVLSVLLALACISGDAQAQSTASDEPESANVTELDVIEVTGQFETRDEAGRNDVFAKDCHGSIFPDNFLSVPETYHDQESLITSSPRLQP